MPMTSVVIPTYNRQVQLARALESVAAQSAADFEVIVVDDGSTDETVDAVARFDNRFCYIFQAHAGQARARNRGILAARGEVIAFLDSDDRWSPHHIANGSRAMALYPDAGLVYSDSVKARLPLSGSKGVARIRSENCFARLFLHNFIRTPSVLVRKHCLLEVGMFNENYAHFEDYDLWLRIARRYPVARILEPSVTIHRQGDNLSESPTGNRDVILQIIEKNFDPTVITARDYRRRVSNCHLMLARSAFKRSDRARAWVHLRASRRLTPYRLRPYRYYLKTLTRGLI